MRLNIFRIPSDQWAALKKKLAEKGLSSTRELDQDGWKGSFLFCAEPPPGSIRWVDTFSDYLGGLQYFNRSYFAAILLQKAGSHYAMTFGKTHFFVRPFCDYDFGIEMAKRIVDPGDVAQTGARRFQGKQKKDIRSYTDGARLSVPPGNSIEFLQGKILASKIDTFGKDAKFGTSCLFEPDIQPDDIGLFLSKIEKELTASARFKLPRTLVLVDSEEIDRYDGKLIDELLSPVGVSDIALDTFDLFGVDFVFSSSGSFTLKCGHYRPLDVSRLTIKVVKDFIAEKQIPPEKILSLKITHHRDEDPDFTQSIKEAVDFICDKDRVVLRGGKWLKFNEDYLEALDAAIRRIEVEETEEHLIETSMEEGDFNKSLASQGYSVVDKNFNILKTKGKAISEAWDLQKGETVYAVKFGTPQKLNYVVDQASTAIELISNQANLNETPPFKRYCLWLGYRANRIPGSLADSGSIILKQKVEAWARQCEEAGITPVLKLSRKLHIKHDALVT